MKYRNLFVAGPDRLKDSIAGDAGDVWKPAVLCLLQDLEAFEKQWSVEITIDQIKSKFADLCVYTGMRIPVESGPWRFHDTWWYRLRVWAYHQFSNKRWWYQLRLWKLVPYPNPLKQYEWYDSESKVWRRKSQFNYGDTPIAVYMDERLQALIHSAAWTCRHTCEDCGTFSPEVKLFTRGWWVNLCPECSKKQEQDRS